MIKDEVIHGHLCHGSIVECLELMPKEGSMTTWRGLCTYMGLEGGGGPLFAEVVGSVHEEVHAVCCYDGHHQQPHASKLGGRGRSQGSRPHNRDHMYTLLLIYTILIHSLKRVRERYNKQTSTVQCANTALRMHSILTSCDNHSPGAGGQNAHLSGNPWTGQFCRWGYSSWLHVTHV